MRALSPASMNINAAETELPRTDLPDAKWAEGSLLLMRPGHIISGTSSQRIPILIIRKAGIHQRISGNNSRNYIEFPFQIEVDHPLVEYDVVVKGGELQRMAARGKFYIHLYECLSAHNVLFPPVAPIRLFY